MFFPKHFDIFLKHREVSTGLKEGMRDLLITLNTLITPLIMP